MARHNIFIPKVIPCRETTCLKRFSTTAGTTKHFRVKHAHFTPTVTALQPLRPHPEAQTATPEQDIPFLDPQAPFDPPPSPGVNQGRAEPQGAPRENQERVEYHPLLNGLPCDATGNFLPKGAPPPPFDDPLPTDWSPYDD
ncbi:hypothetical protein H0H92_002078 [Tricholoma furcatifolium]|nr:hypothetical protein H0H92_002078 [Tricholoma furcatifolium]